MIVGTVVTFIMITRSRFSEKHKTILIYACILLLFFFLTHVLRRPSTDILETFPHDLALASKEVLLCKCAESAP